jgi:hypothetical protein
MTTYIKFIPSNSVAPRFTTTFDEDSYTIIVTWNVASQRYFINVYSIVGNWICTVPMIETEIGNKITDISYDKYNNVLVVTINGNLWRPPGMIVKFDIENCVPDDINGSYDCLMLNSNTFTIPAPVATRGQVTILGSATRFMNLVAGYFQSSSLIYRNRMFEVRP